jgi:hypothetical protein
VSWRAPPELWNEANLLRALPEHSNSNKMKLLFQEFIAGNLFLESSSFPQRKKA